MNKTNKTTMPGFSAEASLYQADHDGHSPAVQMALEGQDAGSVRMASPFFQGKVAERSSRNVLVVPQASSGECTAWAACCFSGNPFCCAAWFGACHP